MLLNKLCSSQFSYFRILALFSLQIYKFLDLFLRKKIVFSSSWIQNKSYSFRLISPELRFEVQFKPPVASYSPRNTHKASRNAPANRIKGP